MAARLLLEALRGSEETAWPVSGAQEERLKQQNPKGRLLELATRLKVGPPVFSVEPAVSGFVGKASLPLRNEPALVSGAYAARLAKTAEQAAAADLLKALHAWMHGERPKIAVEDPPAGAADGLGCSDARGHAARAARQGPAHAAQRDAPARAHRARGDGFEVVPP